MRITRAGRKAAALATATVVASALTAAPAAAHGTTKPLGTKSLAAVLTTDKSGFDRNGHDYDILTNAVLAVLKTKPSSPVKVLTDGKTPVTAFIPNDLAFRRLVADIQHTKRLPAEKTAFTTVTGLGINTVESVLLYHVIPGTTITGKTALKSDGATLKTATGSTIKVDVYGRWHQRIALIDADRNDRNPRVNRFDLNKGNKQIAHSIDRVLRPINLP